METIQWVYIVYEVKSYAIDSVWLDAEKAEAAALNANEKSKPIYGEMYLYVVNKFDVSR